MRYARRIFDGGTQPYQDLHSAIDTFTDASPKAEAEAVIALFEDIPVSDRCYITNYRHLYAISACVGSELPAESPSYSEHGSGEGDVLLWFSQSDRDAADSLPSDAELTTAYYSTVVTLRYILTHCEDFDGKQAYVIKIEKAFNRIAQIQKDIDALKADIREYLYPFDRIGFTIGKRSTPFMTATRHSRNTTAHNSTPPIRRDCSKAKRRWMICIAPH